VTAVPPELIGWLRGLQTSQRRTARGQFIIICCLAVHFLLSAWILYLLLTGHVEGPGTAPLTRPSVHHALAFAVPATPNA